MTTIMLITDARPASDLRQRYVLLLLISFSASSASPVLTLPPPAAPCRQLTDAPPGPSRLTPQLQFEPFVSGFIATPVIQWRCGARRSPRGRGAAACRLTLSGREVLNTSRRSADRQVPRGRWCLVSLGPPPPACRPSCAARHTWNLARPDVS